MKRLLMVIAAGWLLPSVAGATMSRNRGALSTTTVATDTTTATITFFWNPESNTSGQSVDFPTSSTVSFTASGSSWVVTASSDAYLGSFSLDNRNGGSKRIHIPTMTPTGLSVVSFAEGSLGHSYNIRETPIGMDGEMFWSTNTTGARWMMGIKVGANNLSCQYLNVSTGIIESDSRLSSGTAHYIVWRWDYDGDKLGIAGCRIEIDGVVAASTGGAVGVMPTAQFDTTTNQYEITEGGFDGNVIWHYLDAIRISSDPQANLYSRRLSLTP